jgi:hypothetical protein
MDHGFKISLNSVALVALGESTVKLTKLAKLALLHVAAEV